MRAGDLLFYAGADDNAIDCAIMAAQAAGGQPSRFVHVEVAVSDAISIGAVPPLVRPHWVADHPPAAIASPPYADDAARDRAVRRAVLEAGTPYDVPGVVVFGVGRALPQSWQERLREAQGRLTSHSVWCSQLAALCLAEAGLVAPTAADWTAPADLARWLGVAEPG